MSKNIAKIECFFNIIFKFLMMKSPITLHRKIETNGYFAQVNSKHTINVAHSDALKKLT